MQLREDPTYHATLLRYKSPKTGDYVFRVDCFRQVKSGRKEKHKTAILNDIKFTKSKNSEQYIDARMRALEICRDLKAENEKRLEELKPKLREDMPFVELCDKWHQYHMSDNRPGTKEQSELILRDIKGYFEGARINIQDLKPEYLIGFRDYLVAKGKSADRIYRIMKDLKRIIRYAIDEQYIHSFDMPDRFFNGIKEKAKKQKKNKTRKKTPMSWDEAKIYLEKTKDTELEIISYLRLHTGIRVEEACALPWRCVDLKQDLITIEQVKTDNRQVRLEKYIAKSDNSLYRVIPIDTELHEYLKGSLKKQKQNKEIYGDMYQDPDGEDYVIRRKDGSQLRPKSYSRGYRRLVDNDEELKKLPYNTFYDLRHTFANHAVDMGVSMRTLAAIFGDDIQTVQQYYIKKQDSKKACEEYKRIINNTTC